MITDHNSTAVIVNQFPMKKNWTEGTYRFGQGFNNTMTYQEAFDAEGRLPTAVYDVQLSNYAGALNQAGTEQGREFWNAYPTQACETQCTTAAFKVLSAGGLDLSFTKYKSGTIWPDTMNSWMRQLSNQKDSGVLLRK